MAVAVLSPWPTTPAALANATARLQVAVQGAATDSDERAAGLGAVASATVENYAPNAPQAIKDEAVIRFAGYLAQSDFGTIAKESLGPQDAEYVTNHANAFRNCGAAMLLTRWRVRRGGVIGGQVAPAPPEPKPEPEPDPEPEPMPTELPAIRFFRVELVAGISGLPQVNAWTAQQWIDNSSGEVPGATLRTVSMAAPVYCYQAAYHYPQGGTQYEWAAVAVADGDDPPTHYRLGDNVQPDNWPQRWTQAGGQAVIEGGAHDIYFWPVVVAAFPATLRFEWPV